MDAQTCNHRGHEPSGLLNTKMSLGPLRVIEGGLNCQTLRNQWEICHGNNDLIHQWPKIIYYRPTSFLPLSHSLFLAYPPTQPQEHALFHPLKTFSCLGTSRTGTISSQFTTLTLWCMSLRLSMWTSQSNATSIPLWMMLVWSRVIYHFSLTYIHSHLLLPSSFGPIIICTAFNLNFFLHANISSVHTKTTLLCS